MIIEIPNITEPFYRDNPIWQFERKLHAKHKHVGVIYLYENTANGKVYIGQTVSPYKRHSAHFRTALNENSSDYTTSFHNAIRKYGVSSFKYFVLRIVCSDDYNKVKNKLHALEIKYISQYGSINRDKGYNIQTGGTIGGYISNNKSRTVYQFDMEGNLLQQYSSLTEAARNMNGVANVIKNACLHRERAYNYRWSFSERPSELKSRSVYQYNLNGEYVRSFSNMSEAARYIGALPSSVSSAVVNNSVCYNSYWRRYKTDILPIEEFPNAVCQYDLDGKFVKWYHNVNEAVKAMNASGSSAICAAITRHNAYHGYLWRKEKQDFIDPADGRFINKAPVVAIYPDGHTALYETIKDAALDNNVSNGTVNRSIRNLPTLSNIKFVRHNEYNNWINSANLTKH